MVVFSVLACKLGGGSFANWVAAVLQIIMTFSNSIKPFAIYWPSNGVAGVSQFQIIMTIGLQMGWPELHQ